VVWRATRLALGLGFNRTTIAADAGSAGVGRNGTDRRSPIEILMACAAGRISIGFAALTS
jgi:hypothetical protein